MSSLDEFQQKAVTVMSKNTLVVAPPGSGKTTVIINRIKFLMEELDVKAKNIIVITFTKAAANNMKERFQNLCKDSEPPFFGTFHGLFYKILIRYRGNIKIIEQNEAYTVIKRALQEKIDDVGDEKIKEVLNNISIYKSLFYKKSEKDSFNLSISNDLFDHCFEKYEDYKKNKGLLDFDDLQLECKKVLEENPRLLMSYRYLFKHILVDEFQDCDNIQIGMLKLFDSNLFCVGDEDQCIYSFRGSNPDTMVDFEDEFKGGEKIYLNYNYRSLENIVDLSKEIIRKNKYRHNKSIESFRNGQGEIKFNTPFDESEQVKDIIKHVKDYKSNGYNYKDNAIIYRTNMESRSIIDGCIREKVPFRLLDKEYDFFNHFICRDMLSYLKLSIYPQDKDCFERIINKPFRYVSKVAIQKIKNSKENINVFDLLLNHGEIHPFQIKKIEDLKKDINMLNKMSLPSAIDFILMDLEYLDYLREYSEKYRQNYDELLEIVEEFKNAAKDSNTITNFLVHIENVKENLKEMSKNTNVDTVILSTIHGVKGMEFKNVYIIDINKEIIPHKNSIDDPKLIEEERRLFYVGVTRAINNLYLYSPKTIKGKFKEKSMFLPKDKLIQSDKYECGVKMYDTVMHKFYGLGVVEKIKKDNLVIKFDDDIRRKFSSKVLVENNLIKKVNNIEK